MAIASAPTARITLGHAAQGGPSRRIFRAVQTLLKRLGRRSRASAFSWTMESVRRSDIGEFWLYVPKRLQ